MHRYTLGRAIGEGAFGDVHIAYNTETGDRVRDAFAGAWVFSVHRSQVILDSGS
jgi:serine/threonine protein kinase